MQKSIVALRPSEQFQRAVGNHLVSVHVGRCASSALDDVHHELLVQPAGPDFFRGRNNGIGARCVEQRKFAVALCCRQFDRSERPDEIGIDRDRRAGDREILYRTKRMDTIIGFRRNIAIAKQIMFAPRTHRGLPSGCTTCRR